MDLLQYASAVKADCDDCVNSLVKELKEFQSRLTENQEMMIIANGFSFRLEKLRHENNTVIYYGSTSDNVTVVQVQHYHQLNVSFFAVQKRVEDKPAVRIGFVAD